MCRMDDAFEKRMNLEGNREIRRKTGRHHRRKAAAMAGALMLSASLLAGCASATGVAGTLGTAGSTATQQAAVATNLVAESTASALNGDPANGNNTDGLVAANVSYEYDTTDLDAGWNSSTATQIKLNGDSIEFTGAGVSVSGQTLTITAAGTYVFSGKLNDGQIIVYTEQAGAVRLVLNGADITCSDMSPIYVMKAERAVVILADGSLNRIEDGSAYPNVDVESGEPNAAIFSKSDLTFNGTGTLTVEGNCKHGIVSKDSLKIVSGTLNVTAASDGIRGRDLVAMKDGNVTIKAGSDGIQSNNDEDATKGFIAIDGGILNITAEQDGIQAETYVLVRAGALAVTTGGGAPETTRSGNGFGGGMGGGGNADKTTESSKAIKAGVDILVSGGTFTLNAADDAIHASGSVSIANSEITLATGDDGIHADKEIVYESGTLLIKQSYEALESGNITVNGGTLTLTASDDGFNVSGGNDSSATGGGFGNDSFAVLDNAFLTIHGGTIDLNAGGDGLDSNGSIAMTGGTVVVDGPVDDGNGAIDYNGTFKMTGGTLLAVGSSGMAQAPDDSSTQQAILVGFDATMPAGTLIHLESSDGADILTYSPEKQFQSFVLCSPELVAGATYQISTGGTATGTPVNGLYTDGTWSGGTDVFSVTLSEQIATVGSVGHGGMGGAQGGGMRAPGRP